MKLHRWESITAASALLLGMLTACGADNAPASMCTDPLHDSLAALSTQPSALSSQGFGEDSAEDPGDDSGEDSGEDSTDSLRTSAHDSSNDSGDSDKPQTVDAKTLVYCTTEAIGKLDGYRETQLLNGDEISSSRVNVNPLRVHITLADPQAGDIEEVIMVESLTFAKLDGKWIEATEDNPNSTVKALLNLPQSFQTQFNPKLRAAGTSESVIYTVEGTDTVLNQPVLVLRAKIASETGEFTSKYFVTKDYLVLRSQIIRADGSTTTSEMTAAGEREDIANPILAQHNAQ